MRDLFEAWIGLSYYVSLSRAVAVVQVALLGSLVVWCQRRFYLELKSRNCQHFFRLAFVCTIQCFLLCPFFFLQLPGDMSARQTSRSPTDSMHLAVCQWATKDGRDKLGLPPTDGRLVGKRVKAAPRADEWQLGIDLLNKIQFEVCRGNCYWLLRSGAALGAVRNNTYIDDDGDVYIVFDDSPGHWRSYEEFLLAIEQFVRSRDEFGQPRREVRIRKALGGSAPDYTFTASNGYIWTAVRIFWSLWRGVDFLLLSLRQSNITSPQVLALSIDPIPLSIVGEYISEAKVCAKKGTPVRHSYFEQLRLRSRVTKIEYLAYGWWAIDGVNNFRRVVGLVIPGVWDGKPWWLQPKAEDPPLESLKLCEEVRPLMEFRNLCRCPFGRFNLDESSWTGSGSTQRSRRPLQIDLSSDNILWAQCSELKPQYLELVYGEGWRTPSNKHNYGV
eukprot:TRINITY_DN17890_c0_g1_i1.p1 TRINITY_DN17890_c0_g1~~TRINITY_DN17890_c0_g1_i1.p1  ORF type:complete len:444 (+),score=48.54 TRINITY_DN17890_c0_g1_i1:102-1433(+)